ncbi:MAG: diphosphate--fructose-6-phosphate 1-phosphotransferase [Deltaproteobacteria bacterium]|nr:diphosphate--fructose-6-phosphate 1-phosphotransferase [Deltaproteobacteria bacterium]
MADIDNGKGARTSSRQADKTLAILVGGGPAPGINGVIRSATIEAVNSGLRVIGIYDGYKWLARGSSTHVERLTIDKVSRIHYRGGSILRTSRFNPTKDADAMRAVLGVLTELEVDYLLSIGGDDTAFSASQLGLMAGGQIQTAHVPKTIDNDLPLPGQMLTFGYQTAREVGAQLVKNIMEDAFTSNRWYFVVTMGRKAGHLALGIGNAAGATLTIVGEEFRDRPVRLSHVCDILEGAIIKRRLLGRDYGVAVLSEGLIESIDVADLKSYKELEYDAHGHVRYSEIALAELVKEEVKKRLKKRQIDCTIVNKDIGYELRCQPANSFDLEYTQNLGYTAIRFLIGGGTASMIALRDGAPYIISFNNIMDPKTGRIRTRLVDVDNAYYKMCREYMIRLDRSDFEDFKRLSRLARVANCTPEEFKGQFGYLADDY